MLLFFVGRCFTLDMFCRYAELLIKNPLLVDYIDEILRDERLSLNDPVIANFIEIYYPKVSA